VGFRTPWRTDDDQSSFLQGHVSNHHVIADHFQKKIKKKKAPGSIPKWQNKTCNRRSFSSTAKRQYEIEVIG